MYSATGERVNIIQRNTLITNASNFQKVQETNVYFNYRDILAESQELGTHLRHNFKFLCHVKGVSMCHVMRQAKVDYGFSLLPGTLMSLGRPKAKFSSSYIRLLEMALQLVVGYNFKPFDLVLKEYYTGRDKAPDILPKDKRDNFHKYIEKSKSRQKRKVA